MTHLSQLVFGFGFLSAMGVGAISLAGLSGLGSAGIVTTALRWLTAASIANLTLFLLLSMLIA